MVETWKKIPGRRGYEVSNLGRVKSLDRLIKNRPGRRRRPWRGRILQPATGSFGHPFVSVGGNRPMYIHELVMRAFVGPRPDGHHVCHYDGDPTNNKLNNLRYDTPSGNGADTIRLGRIARGEKNGSAKLAAKQVRAIRKSKASHRALAALYKISRGNIAFIKRRETWAWLD